MHRLTHFIWSRTEVVGMCDITEEDRDKGRGQELSVRMMHYTIGHAHCYHLAPVSVLCGRRERHGADRWRGEGQLKLHTREGNARLRLAG